MYVQHGRDLTRPRSSPRKRAAQRPHWFHCHNTAGFLAGQYVQEMDGMAGRALRCHCCERVSWYALRRYAGTSHHIPRSSQQQFSCSTFYRRVRTVSILHERAQPQGHKTARFQWVSTSSVRLSAWRCSTQLWGLQYFAWVATSDDLSFSPQHSPLLWSLVAFHHGR